MQRIDTVDNLFSDGDPQNNIKGTRVSAAFLNAVQEEIANAIEEGGLVLDPEDNTQLAAILETIRASIGEYVKISDVKAAITTGGDFVAGSWVTRALNTEYDPAGIASLASNQITLPAGTYRTRASAPASEIMDHQVRIYNITASAVLLLGTSEYTSPESVIGTITRSFVQGEFVLSSTSVIELQHRCTSSHVNTGMGRAVSWGDNVFTEIELWRKS